MILFVNTYEEQPTNLLESTKHKFDQNFNLFYSKILYFYEDSSAVGFEGQRMLVFIAVHLSVKQPHNIICATLWVLSKCR